MEQGVGDRSCIPTLTESLLVVRAVDPAIAGAKAAIRLVSLEPGQGGVDPVYFSPGDHVRLDILIHSIRILFT
jgi:hypothetical protein